MPSMKQILAALGVLIAIPAAAQQAPQISSAEAALANCTVNQVRLEDQLKAAQQQIADMKKEAAAKAPATPPVPGEDKK